MGVYVPMKKPSAANQKPASKKSSRPKLKVIEGKRGKVANKAPNVEAPEGEAASFLVRFVASTVDGLLISVAGCFVTFPLMLGGGLAILAMSAVIMPVIMAVLVFAYHAHFYKKEGTTPGKKLFGLVVLDETTGGFLDYKKTFVRECIIKYISYMMFCAGHFVALFRPDKKAAHDLVCGSRVIQIKK